MKDSPAMLRRLPIALVALVVSLAIVLNFGLADEKKAATQGITQAQEWEIHLQSASQAFEDGRHKEAKREYNKALKAAKKLGKKSPEVAECLCEIADFYLSLEKYKDARKNRELALKIEEEIYGAENPKVAASLYFIADALVRENIPSATTEEISSFDERKHTKVLKESEKPLEFLNRVEIIQAKTIGTLTLDYSKTLVLKAALQLERMNNTKIAVSRGFQVIGVPVMVDNLTLDALVSVYLEECDRLKLMCDSALTIQQAQLEPNHPDLVRTRSVLTKLLAEIAFVKGEE